jgi:hypothetical protein
VVDRRRLRRALLAGRPVHGRAVAGHVWGAARLGRQRARAQSRVRVDRSVRVRPSRRCGAVVALAPRTALVG